MTLLRTMVVTLSPLLRELVTSILSPDFVVDVVEVCDTRERLIERVRDLAPDFVLIGLQEQETDTVAAPLLAASPRARILALARNGEHGWLHGPRGRSANLLDLAVLALKQAMRECGPSPLA